MADPSRPSAIIAAIIDAAVPIPSPADMLAAAAPLEPRARSSARKATKTDGEAGRPNLRVVSSSDDAASPPDPSRRVDDDFASETSHSGGSARKRHSDQGGGDRGRPSGDDPDELNRRLAWFPLSDLGNVNRFVERQRGRLLYCQALDWLWWDGCRWCREGADQHVIRAEHDTVRGIQDEAKALELEAKSASGDRRDTLVELAKKLKAHGRKSEGSSKMSPIHKHASAYLSVETAKLDADPLMINVKNGTLVARREWSEADGDFENWPAHGDFIRLKPHNPADLITKLAPVVFDPQAERQQFDAFIGHVQPDAAMRRFLQQWKGYSCTADASEHRMALFIGQGRNGKSVLEDTTAFVAGDYAETVPIETFLATGREANANAPSPARALLHNARMVRTSEPNQGVKLDEGFIKLVTGGEPIQARNLNLPLFRFYPVLKLTVSGNHRPKIGGTDDGIWSRVTFVPFGVFIPPEQRDRKLTEKLRAEGSGILNWMLDGLSDWIEHGLILPETVQAATAEYRRDSDQLGRFIEICVVIDPKERTQSSVFLAVFNAWARVNGGTEWTGRGLANAMTERGYKKDKSSVMFWLGIRLTKSEEDFADGRQGAFGRQGGGSASSSGASSQAEADEMTF